MKRRRISYQKIFSLISFVFILGCFLFYGTKLIKLYMENNNDEDSNNLAMRIKNDNVKHDYFKNINSEYYFVGDVSSNYVMYSNILFRIVKVNNDNSVMLVSDKPLSSLAMGENSFSDSSIKKWLEDEDGIKKFLYKDNILINNNICNDKIDDSKNITCNDTDNSLAIGLLSINDYVNTGNKNSFINNGYYSYLINDSDDGVWFIDNDGKLDNGDGNDIYGIKIVITISSDVNIKDGDGSSDKPYVIDGGEKLFGSYVKLDDDVYRIYDVSDDYFKLVNTNFVMDVNNDEEYLDIYSNYNSFHNDSKNGSLAYYLNNDYLDSLGYSDIVKNGKWYNGYYSVSNSFDYKKSFSKKVDTYVAMLSIGEINLVSELDNFFLMTGVSDESNLVYVYNDDGSVSTKKVTSKAKAVNTIMIDKVDFSKGDGSIDNPYEME